MLTVKGVGIATVAVYDKDIARQRALDLATALSHLREEVLYLRNRSSGVTLKVEGDRISPA